MDTLYRQAILILAHNEVDHLAALCKKLSECFCVYVHFDAKNYARNIDNLKRHLNIPNVYLFSKHEVNWGAFSVIEATMYLISEALKNTNIEYMHLMSGQDWIARPVSEIYKYFCDNNSIYMTYAPANYIQLRFGNVEDWQKLYYPYDIINRRSFIGSVFEKISILIQKIFRIDKLKKYKITETIYKGSQWWSIPRDTIEYIFREYTYNTSLVKVFRTGFCADEMFFQTIICNSDLYAHRIINDNMRYVAWQKKHCSYPAIIDEYDLDTIKRGNYFFIRKVSNIFSAKLIENLNC